MNKNILIIGGGVINKGAETMVRTVQTEFAKRFENVSFFMERSSIPIETISQINQLGINIIERKIPNKLLRLMELIDIAIQHPYLLSVIYKWRNYFCGWKNLLREIDLIIDISGYKWLDTSDLKSLLKEFPASYFAWKKNIPVYYLPQAWGPFKKQTKQTRICRWVCKKATAFYARDVQSQQYLAELLDVPINEIQLSPDIAFLFQLSGKYENKINQKIQKLKTSKEIIGVVPNMRIYERTKGEERDNCYVKALIEFVNYLSNNGHSIVLIPHEINPKENFKDDRFLCNQILTYSDDPTKILFDNDVFDAEYLKSLISKCDVIVTSRYHALVASLELIKPIVVIGWSHKYEELLNEFNLSEYILDSDSDGEKLTMIFNQVLKYKISTIQNIKKILPLYQKKGKDLFDLIANNTKNGSN